MIAQTRKRSLTLDLSGNNSPTKLSASNRGGPLSPQKTISPINNLRDLLDNGRSESPTNNKQRDLSDKITPIITTGNGGGVRIEDINRNSPSNGGKLESVSLQSFNAMLEKLSPRTESKVSKSFTRINAFITL